ncbi:MAG: hypothetical protein ACI85O_003909 [Saprospiraceae bacterium]|jgi:hypothetical protein
MAQILYQKFLEDKRIYNLAQASWGRVLTSLLKDLNYTYSPYLNDRHNGKKEYDGNPIFNAYIPEIKRAVRIIQVSPEDEGDDISGWIDDIQLKDKNMKELVLDLKLTKDAKKRARELMSAWIEKELDEKKMCEILAEA